MSRLNRKSKSHRFERLVEDPSSIHEDPPSIHEDEDPSAMNVDDVIPDEYYMNGYCRLRNRDEFYAKRKHGAEIYDGNQYACKKIKIDGEDAIVQYPAKNENGKDVYLTNDKNQVIYPRNVDTQQPIFPIHPVTHEHMYIFVNGQVMYPFHPTTGEPMYLKERSGANILNFNEATGEAIYYRRNEEGDEIYPKDEFGNDVYIRVNGKDIGATLHNGMKYYAKTVDGDEFYPKIFSKPPVTFEK